MFNTLKSLPVIGFFIRYPLLLLAAIGFVGIALNDWIFQQGGALIYGPALLFLALVFALLARHFFYRGTIDKDAADGSFTRFWQTLSPKERVDRSILVFCVFFIGACIVFASVAK